MYRTALEDLREWKQSKYRKPLVIEGARQVGKTWLMKEFGHMEYEKVVYVNFDQKGSAHRLFGEDIAIDRIIEGLEIMAGFKIEAENTLIIFDEIQEAPRALASLKYFCEDASKYHVVCAGSLLGVALHEGSSFPVGKVNLLNLYPLSFKEFLLAEGKAKYAELIEKQDYAMMSAFKEELIFALKQYYYIGGMPEVVLRYEETKDYHEVRNAQNEILNIYEQDFSKHAPLSSVLKIRTVWESLPMQLGKENKKFVYGVLREGARAKDYESAIMWLRDCGLVYKIPRITAAKVPLRAYEDIKAFKLYMVDVGLLSCMAQINVKTLLEGNDLFQEFKGALTEQYVLQQLIHDFKHKIYYYTNDKSTMEIDFVIDFDNRIIPLEVKAEENLKAKSLRSYREKFQPDYAVRTSLADYRLQDDFVNLPLYAIENFSKLKME